MEKNKFTDKEILPVKNYFNGNQFPAEVWYRKYRLNDEKTPKEMFVRLAKEFGETELEWFKNKQNIDINQLSEYGKHRYNELVQNLCPEKFQKHYFGLFNKFEKIVLGGSVMQGVGANNFSSLSNCFVFGKPHDSYSGILMKELEIMQASKRRGGCVEENTKVIIKNKGIIKMKDVKIGDFILSFNTETGLDEWKEVLDWYYTDVELNDQILVKYNNGVTLPTSKKHPILNIKSNGYCYESFNNGNLLNSTNKFPNKNINYIFDETLSDIGWLIGAHMGDGSFDYVTNEVGNKIGRFRFVKSDKEVVEKYKERIEKISGSNSQVILSTDKNYKTDVWTYYSTNKNNSLFIEKYFDNQWKNKTLAAVIPSFIKNNNLWIPFIAGLIDTDGFVIETGRIDIELSNKNVIEEICEWLSFNGDYYTTSVKKDSRKETFNDSYRIHILRNSSIYNKLKKYLVNPKRINNIDLSVNDKKTYQSFTVNLFESEINMLSNFRQINDKKLNDLMRANYSNVRKSKKFGLAGIMKAFDCNLFDSKTLDSINSRVSVKEILEDNKIKNNYIDISVEGNNNYYAGNFGFVNIHNCGIDISSIRPENTPVNNQSKISNGPMLFAERYNHGIMEVSQNGRRGALMISMHIKHPDVEKFIISKQDETKLTGCNISIKIDDEFMECALSDTPYIQHFPVDFDWTKIKKYDNKVNGIDIKKHLFETIKINELTTYEFEMSDGTKQKIFVQKINAKKLWETLIHCAWKTGEPGIIFEDNHYNYSPDSLYPQYRQVTTNPCFHPDSKILTQSGYHKIGDLMGVGNWFWNGKNWSYATVQATGVNEMLYKVTLSDGTELLVTGYHKWPTTKGNKTTLELMQSEDIDSEDGKFQLLNFDLPIVNYGTFELEGSKYSGFGKEYFEGDFNEDNERFDLLKNIHIDNRICYIDGIINKYFINGHKCIECTMDVNKLDRMKHLKLILSTVGVKAYLEITPSVVSLIIHDYYCQQLFNLGVRYNNTFGSKYSQKAMLTDTYNKPIIPIKIFSIEEHDITEKVFCLTEKERNMVCVDGIVTGNCGEIFMQPYDSCRLLALNLSTYVSNPYKKKSSFNFEQFYIDCYEQLITGNILVELEIKYIQKIIDKINNDDNESLEYKEQELNLWKKIQTTAKLGRRCGCGFLALGDLFAELGLSYGSTESLEFSEKIMKIKLKAELNATIDLSIIDKPFDGYNSQIEYDFDNNSGKNGFYQMLKDNYTEEYERMLKHGRANISWNTVAPTGSLGILTQTTSGIEPCFMPMYKRRKKCITSDERVDFIDVDGQKFTEFYVLHEGFKNWLKVNVGNYDINPIIEPCFIDNIDEVPKDIVESWVKQSPYGDSCANDINYLDRIKMQSIIQKYVTHSISSTINLQNSATEDDVKKIYDEAWKHKLKGLTVYRDGSRQGVMVSADGKKKDTSVEEFESNKAPKRPKRIKAHYYIIEYRKKIYSVIIGLYLNKPYEIFICSGVDDLPLIMDGEYIEGELVKESKNWYYFMNDFVLVKDIQDCQADEKLISLMLSGLLRHRTPLQFIIKIIQKSQPFVGTVNYKLCKILGKYVVNGTEDGSICPECGGHLRFEGGCIICPDCGYSKC